MNWPDVSEVTSRFKNGLTKSTSLFSEFYNNYVENNPTDEIVNLLGIKDLEVLKQYSNMHRYFIFKKINELDELDNQDLLTKDNCLSLSQHKVVQPRYKDLKMPFLTALDPYLIYKDICIPRSYIQNANNQIDIKINKLQQNRSNLSNKLQYLINDAREKLSKRYLS